jgi:hypothetical protein
MNTFINILGKGEQFPLFINENLLVLTLILPLASIIILYTTENFGKNFMYKFALYSSATSFLLSLFL